MYNGSKICIIPDVLLCPYLIGVVIGLGDGVVVVAVAAAAAAADARDPALQRLHNSFFFCSAVYQFSAQILTFHP